MTELRRFILDYAVFAVLFVGSIVGHWWFVFKYKPTGFVIRVPVTDREAGRTSVAIQLVAAKPKPKLELEEIVKETRPKELPKPTEMLIAKAELPPEKIVTAEIPRPDAPPVFAPPPPPLEKIDEELPPEEKPPEKMKKKQTVAKPPEMEQVETDSEVTIMTVERRGIDTPPQLLSNPDPSYPRSLWQQRIQANLELSIDIDAAGNVVAARVFRSSGYEEFDRSALDAIKTWKLSPAMFEGKPVAHEDVHVPISFKIRAR